MPKKERKIKGFRRLLFHRRWKPIVHEMRIDTLKDISLKDKYGTYPVDNKCKNEFKKLDAYRKHIKESIPSYILFMESFNKILLGLEKEEIIGQTKFKARIKAAKSSWINTDIKELDDIYGLELITQNERDKEILMLIVNNFFNASTIKDKKHNKSNGYIAYHCIGTLGKKMTNLDEIDLEEQIKTSKTIQLKNIFRNLPSERQKKYSKKEIYIEVPKYPYLLAEIGEKGGLDRRTQKGIKVAIKYLRDIFKEYPDERIIKEFPFTEVQFKTKEVEYAIEYGTATHDKYKGENKEEIIEDIKTRYLKRQLVRGIDFPFVFLRNEDNEMELQSTNKTLVQMWPFLKETIEQYNKTNKTPLESFDLHLGRVFPELLSYIEKNAKKEPTIPVAAESTPDSIWEVLKYKIVNNDTILPYYNLKEGERN